MFGPRELLQLVIENVDTFPSSWKQSLATHGLQITQRENGPCGALAAVLGNVIACMHEDDQSIDPIAQVSDALLARAVKRILERCGERVQLACWSAEPCASDIQFREIDEIDSIIPQYCGEGGAFLLVCSCAQTRGLQRLQSELSESGDCTLLNGPWSFCSGGLMSLLLVGNAKGNFFFDENEARTLAVGLLSHSEALVQIAVCESLKSPRYPIWILHAHDHFTLLYSKSIQLEDSFTLLHFDSLFDRTTRVAVQRQARDEIETTEQARDDEIDDFVQCNVDDKKANSDYRSWRFEVLLRDTVRYSNVVQQAQQQQSKSWRCGACYRTRFETMWFALNQDENCSRCGKLRAESEATAWLHYTQLPARIRKIVDSAFAAKLQTLIETKWPNSILMEHSL